MEAPCDDPVVIPVDGGEACAPRLSSAVDSGSEYTDDSEEGGEEGEGEEGQTGAGGAAAAAATAAAAAASAAPAGSATTFAPASVGSDDDDLLLDDDDGAHTYTSSVLDASAAPRSTLDTGVEGEEDDDTSAPATFSSSLLGSSAYHRRSSQTATDGIPGDDPSATWASSVGGSRSMTRGGLSSTYLDEDAVLVDEEEVDSMVASSTAWPSTRRAPPQTVEADAEDTPVASSTAWPSARQAPPPAVGAAAAATAAAVAAAAAAGAVTRGRSPPPPHPAAVVSDDSWRRAAPAAEEPSAAEEADTLPIPPPPPSPPAAGAPAATAGLAALPMPPAAMPADVLRTLHASSGRATPPASGRATPPMAGLPMLPSNLRAPSPTPPAEAPGRAPPVAGLAMLPSNLRTPSPTPPGAAPVSALRTPDATLPMMPAAFRSRPPPGPPPAAIAPTAHSPPVVAGAAAADGSPVSPRPPPSARVVGLSVVGPAGAAAAAAASRVHSLLIPAVRRPGTPTGRRYAVHGGAGLSAFVTGNLIRASRRGGGGGAGAATAAGGGAAGAATAGSQVGATPPGVSSVVLRGHKAPVVDLEWLPSAAGEVLATLGSCDQDGVVYLWFVTVDGGGGPGAVRLVRKYSFFTLRRSRRAYYNRIRLAGGGVGGACTMVLVANDGSPPRLIKFRAMPVFGERGGRPVGVDMREGGGNTLGGGGGQPAPTPPVVAVASTAESFADPAGGGEAVPVSPTPSSVVQRVSSTASGVSASSEGSGVSESVATTSAATSSYYEDASVASAASRGGRGRQMSAVRAEPGDPLPMDDGEGVARNATFPLRAAEAGQVDVEDDIAAAAWRASSSSASGPSHGNPTGGGLYVSDEPVGEEGESDVEYDEEVGSSEEEAAHRRGAGAGVGYGGDGRHAGAGDGVGMDSADRVGRYGTGAWGRGQGVGGVEEYDEEEDEGGAELAGHREYQDEMPSEPSLL